eukprot:NODE_1069_length_1120_cov_49.847806_g818_i0.p1 GENE.NODE_1069_length_1120_cov_49.847806_g818_i0~~NODE_1069_length_1120_cov_49.847806_g818_i0.p1  ORF type:complete len:225 (-),score=21.48 NODE_1069_length_1120_cov_49.847806_g818_i0:33-707(-)
MNHGVKLCLSKVGAFLSSKIREFLPILSMPSKRMATTMCSISPQAFLMHNVVPYLQAITPMLGGMALIPPLDSPPRLIRFPSHSFIRRHMCFSPAAVRAGRWWTTLTYPLVHDTREQLCVNLINFALSGWRPFQSLGLVHFHCCYILGAVAGTIFELWCKNIKGWHLKKKNLCFIPIRNPNQGTLFSDKRVASELTHPKSHSGELHQTIIPTRFILRGLVKLVS